MCGHLTLVPSQAYLRRSGKSIFLQPQTSNTTMASLRYFFVTLLFLVCLAWKTTNALDVDPSTQPTAPSLKKTQEQGMVRRGLQSAPSDSPFNIIFIFPACVDNQNTRLDVFRFIIFFIFRRDDLGFCPDNPLPTPTPSDVPSSQPSGEPSMSSEPSSEPSDVPSGTPSATPSSAPSYTPSETPSGTPSATPSSAPSGAPSYTPSSAPSYTPSETPSGMPSATPSDEPSSIPSSSPSDTPSGMPSVTPSGVPSAEPSDAPSSMPSAGPSFAPRWEVAPNAGVSCDVVCGAGNCDPSIVTGGISTEAEFNNVAERLQLTGSTPADLNCNSFGATPLIGAPSFRENGSLDICNIPAPTMSPADTRRCTNAAVNFRRICCCGDTLEACPLTDPSP